MPRGQLRLYTKTKRPDDLMPPIYAHSKYEIIAEDEVVIWRNIIKYTISEFSNNQLYMRPIAQMYIM